jgi:hypothetical protein
MESHSCEGRVLSETVTCPQIERFVEVCPGTVRKGYWKENRTRLEVLSREPLAL